jgi:hypothetical protein
MNRKRDRRWRMVEKERKPIKMEEILKFKIPEVEEEEVYLLEDIETGERIVRLKKEVEEMKKKGEVK